MDRKKDPKRKSKKKVQIDTSTIKKVKPKEKLIIGAS